MKDVDYAILHRIHFVHYDHPGKVEVVNNGHTCKLFLKAINIRLKCRSLALTSGIPNNLIFKEED